VLLHPLSGPCKAITTAKPSTPPPNRHDHDHVERMTVSYGLCGATPNQLRIVEHPVDVSTARLRRVASLIVETAIVADGAVR